MIVLGLTGLIGSGKTTVLKFFEKQGATVFISDDYVRQLNHENKEVILAISKHFPEAVTNEEVDIIKLKKLVFSDYFNKIKILEDIYHPHVKAEIKRLINKNRFFFWKIMVIEVPLLFEAKIDSLCSYVVVTSCPLEVRIERITKRNPINMDVLNNIIKKQGSAEEKIKKADFVIDTNTSFTDIESKVTDIMKTIKSKLFISGI